MRLLGAPVRFVAASCAIALSSIACGPAGEPGHTQDPYGLIRSDIEKSTIVQSTSFTRGDFMDSPVIDVYLKAGATVEQAHQLVCAVVSPAVLAAPLSDEDRRDLGVDVWDSTGDRTLAIESDCGL